MISEIILSCIIAGLLFQLLKKPSNYPPGLWGIPLFGHLPLFGSRTFNERVLDMRNKFGDIFIWRMGSQVKVFIFDFNLIKEYLSSEDFIDRPPLCNLSLFKDCVKSNSHLVSSIQYEAEEMTKEFKKVADKPTSLPKQLEIAGCNVIWQMLASRRYEANDSEFIEYYNTNVKKIQILPYNSHLDRFPWIEYILPNFITEKLFKTKELDLVRKWFKEFAMKLIKESEDSLDENNPRDYIDHYLIEMKKPKTEENDYLTYDDLAGVLIDIDGSGSETTKTTITWAIFYLIKFPEVQKKLQEDVDEILIGDQLATLEDKSRLNYLEAFIHELLRLNLFLPNGISRIAARDLFINGFYIPEGTFLCPALNACHHDPKYWKNPEDFEPERFLDENGKFVSPKEGFLPFGSGNRACIGETLTHTTLLIFMSSLVKDFEFSVPNGKEINISPSPFSSSVHYPRVEQNIIITCRK